MPPPKSSKVCPQAEGTIEHHPRSASSEAAGGAWQVCVKLGCIWEEDLGR